MSKIKSNSILKSSILSAIISITFTSCTIPKVDDFTFFGFISKLALYTFFVALIYLTYAIINILTFLLINRNKFIYKSYISIILAIISILIQAYLWILWTAICVQNIITYTDQPEITNDWLYYLSGYLIANLLLVLISNGFELIYVKKGLDDLEKFQLIVFGPNLYMMIILIAFTIFSIFPKLVICLL
jgi:hypothetical protein